MKRVIIGLLLILFSCQICHAGPEIFLGVNKGGAAPESVLKDHASDGADDDTNIFSLNPWYSQTFTAGSAYTLTRIDVNIKSDNAATGNITCYLYSSSPSATGSLLATGSTVAASTIGTSYAYHTFTFSNYSITNGGHYAVVLKISATQDGFYWKADTTPPAGHAFDYSANGSSWSNWTDSWGQNFKTYGY